MSSVLKLCTHRQIVGTAPTLDELLNPIKEQEIGDSLYRFPGGDADILAEATRLPADQSVEDESDESDREMVDELSYREGAELCEKLERSCVIHSDVVGVFVRGHLSFSLPPIL
jgi:hypothetical protein